MKFKKGNIVKAIAAHEGKLPTGVGRVIKTASDSTILCRFDEWDGGHNADGGDGDHCWWYPIDSDCLRLVAPDPENHQFKIGDKGKMVNGIDYEIILDDESEIPFKVRYARNGEETFLWYMRDGKPYCHTDGYTLLPPGKDDPDFKPTPKDQEMTAEQASLELPLKAGGADFITQMSQLLEGVAREAVSESKLRDIVGEMVAAQEPRVIEVRTPPKVVKIDEHRHPMFEKVLRLASSGLNVLLVGPAGCGKTHLAGQVARAMDRPFASISLTSGASESQLTGRLLPTGDGGKFEYHESPFVSMYESGGVFLLDELDAADPNMLLVINTALANGHFTVEARAPACDIIRHENTIIIGAANTYGTGADAQYVGRQQLDAATLDRWYVVEMTYDAALECDMAGLKKKSSSAWNAAPDPTADEIKEIGVWVRKLRDDINKAKLRRTASTRMLEKAIRARKAGISFAEIKADLLAGWSRDELAKVGVSA